MTRSKVIFHFKQKVTFFILAGVFISLGFLKAGSEDRPARWAVKVIGCSLKNFYRVDQKIFRSGQPDKKEMSNLKKFGIREILNLRQFHSDKNKARGTGLVLHRVEMNAAHIKTGAVITALRIIKQSPGPLLIHCHHGSDRTGLIVALYRILFQKWSKQEAIDEMVNGGYGFHRQYDNIIQYIKDMDIGYLQQLLAKAA